MKSIYFLALLFSAHLIFAQVKVKDTVTRKATIGFDKKGNQVLFKAEVPPLIQIAGAPKANYSYFWEFGDGHYSKEPTPKHTYKKKKEYKVNMSVTNNYDNGKPPKTRPKLVSVNEIEDQNLREIASLLETLKLHILKKQ